MRYISVISGVLATLVLAATASAGPGEGKAQVTVSGSEEQRISPPQSRPFEDKSQVTVGGAEYMLSGYIVKVEKDAYWIRKYSGDVVRVAVTEGTHLICPTRPGSKEAKVESKPAGSGFRMGDCPFVAGDSVKAEISDLGWASLVRYETPPTSETMQLGLPQGWEGDIPQGVLSFKAGPHYPVHTKDGYHVGHLAGTLTDTKSGAQYGLLVHAVDGHMMPVPLAALKQEWPQPNQPHMVLLISKARLAEMHAPAYKAANLISIPELHDFWAKATPPEVVAAKEVNVVIDISEKTFHITKGETDQGFSLVGGMPAVIQLRNRDLVAHEFVSTLFRDVPFRISGNATVVKTARASGVRIDPGQTVTLEFTAPVGAVDQYGARESLYDAFWCNVHGKEHGQKMRGEVSIIVTRGEIGGG